MEDRVRTSLVWSRAAFVGSTFFLLGVVGHVSADGLLPGAFAMAFLLSLSVALAGPFLARPASTLRLVLVVVSGQFLVHVVLSVSGGHRGDTGPTAASTTPLPPVQTLSLPTVDGRRVGSLHDAYQVVPGQQPASLTSVPVGHLIDDLVAHAPMMAAHVAAAALMGLWLAAGEKTLWTLLALTAQQLRSVVRLFLPVPTTPRWRVTPTGSRDVSRPHALWHASPPALRGPPVVPAC